MKKLSLTVLILATMFLAGYGVVNAEEADKCPWEYLTGKWQYTDDAGSSSTVEWTSAEGDALMGAWEFADGKATGLVGCRPDKKELVSVGFGTNGTYWETVYTTVTESMLKGHKIERLSDGKSRSGTFEFKRESETLMSTSYDWKDADGNTGSIKGKITAMK